MSAIEREALSALIEAMEFLDHTPSAKEMVWMVNSLYDAGWRLTREPEPIVDAPAPIATSAPAQWPPAGITAPLWTMIGDHAVQLHNAAAVKLCAAGGGLIYEARTAADARRLDQNPADVLRGTFMIGGETFEYLWDGIPF